MKASERVGKIASELRKASVQELAPPSIPYGALERALFDTASVGASRALSAMAKILEITAGELKADEDKEGVA
jgi:hypothetical protein